MSYGYVHVNGRREHILIVERVLGRRLRGTEQVHHVNGNKSDNRPENLVLCPDASYHQLIEYRTQALKECGNANWKKCRKCLRWDDPANMQTKRAPNGRRQMQKYWHYRFRGQCVNKGEHCQIRPHAPRPMPLRRDPAARLAFQQAPTLIVTCAEADICRCGSGTAKRYGEGEQARFYCFDCGRQKKSGFVGRTPGAALTVDSLGRRIA